MRHMTHPPFSTPILQKKDKLKPAITHNKVLKTTC